MTLKTTKAESTRLQVPYSDGEGAPPNVPNGCLGFDPTAEALLVKTSEGWIAVGGGSGGTVAEITAPSGGILVTDPTGPTVQLELDFGTGAGEVCEGDDSRLSDSRAPTGSAGGDLSGTYPNPNVAKVHETSGPTQLTIGAISDGQMLVRSSASVVGAAYVSPTQSMISSLLAPRHWWRADTTVQSGGLVDTITDNGSGAKNFTQTGAARCPTATDANGKTYLAFDGATDYYQAGSASDWTFTNDGTPFTVAMVIGRAALATANERILGTGGANSNLTGFDAMWLYTSATDQGPSFMVGRGTAGQYVVFTRDSIATSSAVLVLVFRMVGNLASYTLGGVTTAPWTVATRANGIQRVASARNASNAFNTSAPGSTLTLCRTAPSSGEFGQSRIYDVVLDNKMWSDRQVALYEAYAAAQYAIAI